MIWSLNKARTPRIPWGDAVMSVERLSCPSMLGNQLKEASGSSYNNLSTELEQMGSATTSWTATMSGFVNLRVSVQVPWRCDLSSV